MHRLLSRTSITVDEAISILLGRTTGPVEYSPTDETQEAEANTPIFDLIYLEDELEVLQGEYDLAKYEDRPKRVIEKKLAALQRQQAIMTQAAAYHCAVLDELNKGEQSVLKVDKALSNIAYTYITLHSFNEWAKRRGSELAGAPDAETPPATSAAPTAVVTKRAHGTKLLDRKDAIFAEIVGRKLNPKALPKFISGKKGLRKEIRNALQASPLFKGSPRFFDKAWEGLFHKDDGRLAYEK